MMKKDFIDHLDERGFFGSHPFEGAVGDGEVVSFYLYNLSGQFTGYQRYNWKGDKKLRKNDEAKYHTYHTSLEACYGLQSLTNPLRPLYIVEGIWDAITLQNLGLQAIAVLTNKPKHLRGFFETIPNKIIAVCDGDKAGMKLSLYSDEYVVLPEGEDPNSMDEDKLKELLGL